MGKCLDVANAAEHIHCPNYIWTVSL